jgi:hypothetical protein
MLGKNWLRFLVSSFTFVSADHVAPPSDDELT